jgi:hypothetical protein
MEIVIPYVPTRLAQNPSLSYFLSIRCQFSCTRKPLAVLIYRQDAGQLPLVVLLPQCGNPVFLIGI